MNRIRDEIRRQRRTPADRSARFRPLPATGPIAARNRDRRGDARQVRSRARAARRRNARSGDRAHRDGLLVRRDRRADGQTERRRGAHDREPRAGAARGGDAPWLTTICSTAAGRIADGEQIDWASITSTLPSERRSRDRRRARAWSRRSRPGIASCINCCRSAADTPPQPDARPRAVGPPRSAEHRRARLVRHRVSRVGHAARAAGRAEAVSRRVRSRCGDAGRPHAGARAPRERRHRLRRGRARRRGRHLDGAGARPARSTTSSRVRARCRRARRRRSAPTWRGRWPRCTPRDCCTATSRRRTWCAKAAAAWC